MIKVPGLKEKLKKCGKVSGPKMPPPKKERNKWNQEKYPRNPWVYIKITTHTTAYTPNNLSIRIAIQSFAHAIFKHITSGNKYPKQNVSQEIQFLKR